MNARGLHALALALAFALGLAACDDEEARTQVMLEIDADPAVRVRLETLRVLIDASDDDGESWEKRISNRYRAADIGGDWKEFAWPARLGLVPAEGRGERQFAVRVQAFDRRGELYVWQQAVAKFSAGRTTLLAITLLDRCTVAALACGDEDCVGTDGCETCRAGNCVDVELLDELPAFDPDRSGSLFDGSVPIGEDGGPRDPDASRDGGTSDPDTGTSDPIDAGSTQPAMDSGAMDSGATQDSAMPEDTGVPPGPERFIVEATTPAASAPVVSDTRALLSVTFSAPVDAQTVNTTSLSVQHGGRNVAGSIATSTRGATFTPDEPWVLSGAYTLTLTATIKSVDGVTLEPFTLGFEIRDGVWSRTPVFDGLGEPVLALARDGYGVIAWARDPGAASPEIRASLFTPPATWSMPATLTTAGASASVVAINARHHAVAVWSGISAGQNVSVWTGGPTWTGGPSVSPGGDPDVFLSASSELFFVASDRANNDALDGYQFTLGGAFPAEIPIAATTFYNSGSQVGVVAGTSVVVWQHDDNGAGLAQIKAGNMTSADGVTLSGQGAVGTKPYMAVNAAQTAAVVVWLQASQNTPGDTRVWAARLNGGTWSGAQSVSGGTAVAQHATAAIDDAGRALATWTEDRAIRSAAFDPGTGTWSSPVPVSTTNTLDNERSSVVLSREGNGLAVWAQNSAGSGINEVWASRYLVGRGWQNATRARISDLEAGTGDIISLAIDDAGRALAAWYQSAKIWVARFE